MTSIFHNGHEQLTLAQNTHGENNFIVELAPNPLSDVFLTAHQTQHG
jgi:hypothetical protein